MAHLVALLIQVEGGSHFDAQLLAQLLVVLVAVELSHLHAALQLSCHCHQVRQHDLAGATPASHMRTVNSLTYLFLGSIARFEGFDDHAASLLLL